MAKWFVVLLLIVVSVIVFDSLAAVKPDVPKREDGESVPAPPKPGDLPFAVEPIAPSFQQRRQLFYDWVLQQPTPDNRGGIWVDIAKLSAGADAINPLAFQAALDYVNQRRDPSDFTLTGLIRMYYLFAGTGKLSSAQEQAIKEALLNWKYWLDEPNQTYVEMWTENHQILNHSIEYLAGQLFPDEIFTNNGQTGKWHMEHARPMIERWITLRAQTGFAEWDSETYYPEDLGALLNLVDFAQDEVIARKATMMVDLILFDIAVDSFYGQYATSHGRVTAPSIKSAAGGSVTTIATLAWGQGRFQSSGNMGVVSLATSPHYEIPPVIEALAYDNPDEYLNLERHSFNLADASKYGLDINKVEDAPLFWGMGAFTNPDVIDLTIRTADTWDLWHYPDFKDLKDLAKILQATHTLGLASRLLDPDTNGILMSEVNKVTYRTPDYMLSSAQSFRPGEKGYQQHIWQATLSPYAVVFVNNPDSLRADDKHRPSYWMANGRQPRTGQFKNLLIALYKIPRYPSAPPPLEARHYAFTHAYFPKWAFDEIVEVPVEGGGGWIFGRVGDGYIGLYSHLPYSWVDTGPDANQEIVAPGYQNVWICQLGRRAIDGSFEAFVESLSQASIRVEKLRVSFQSPGIGNVKFGWREPLEINGQVIPLDGYPRFDNPYAFVPFGSMYYEIAYNDKRLILDFENAVREIGY